MPALSSINPKLRGDVETITLKALEKDRDRRYESAAGLAKDVHRFLNHEPIAARPPSVTYLCRKFVERHTWQAVALAAGSLSLVAALILVAVWGSLVEANRASKEAQRETERAETMAYGAKMGAAEAALRVHDADNALKILEQAPEELRGWEWRHLASRVDQSIRTLVDTKKEIQDIAIDPTGRLLAISFSSPEHVVGIYDIDDGESLAKLPAHAAGSSRIAFSHDGTLLATTSPTTGDPNDRRAMMIRLWDMASLDDPRPIAEWIAHQQKIGSLAFHPKQMILASGSNDRTIKLWDLRNLDKYHTSGRPTETESDATLRGHEGLIPSLAFSPDGSLLASGCFDYTIRLWDVDAALAGSGEPERAVLRGHTYYIYSVAFSPDGRRLASAAIDKTIRLWDVVKSLDQASEARRNGVYVGSTGAAIGVLHGHKEGIYSVAFDPSGTRLVSGGGDMTIRIWDVDEDATISDHRGRREWPVRRRHEIGALRGHAGPVRRVAFLGDGRIVSASSDGAVKLWTPGVQDVPRLRGHISSVFAVTFTPDGLFVISGGGGGYGSFIVWDAELCVPVGRRVFEKRKASTISPAGATPVRFC